VKWNVISFKRKVTVSLKMAVDLDLVIVNPTCIVALCGVDK
jgi:hypothetical protein